MPATLARVLADLVATLEHLGYWNADAVVTYTPAMASQLGLDGFESKVYPTGARYVDVERFRIATPLPDREPVVGFVGRLDQEKGIRQLAQAARLLSDEYRFRFIGDGALKSWIEREFSEEIGAGKIELTGWVPHDQIPNELNRLRMLVLPSQPTEGLPTTILEAFACGTPVYATPVSGVVDVIEPEETGFLINQTDSEALASAISEILAREDLHRISKNARNLAVREYSYEAAVSRYQSIVRSISASPELR
jgi:glycosyltransferase involved in cell wall biosynthesis